MRLEVRGRSASWTRRAATREDAEAGQEIWTTTPSGEDGERATLVAGAHSVRAAGAAAGAPALRAPSPSATWNEWPQPHEADGVRVVDLEPGLLDGLEVVDLGALQIRRAERVDDDLDALDLELVVALLRRRGRSRGRTGSRSSRRPGSRRGGPETSVSSAMSR